ncbi:hypothetical protein [Mycobacterium sp. E1747]|uniref:AbiJ-related protein n=1 Tax=Mycobacterium sp. E1747 TaxID=1834128 RepID=UPI0009EE96FC|nr:hypothetical protein [Mycobacterium sp. E1747]
MSAKLITPVTRRRIFDTITLSKVLWEGRLDEPDFLARIYDLDSMPSTDRRYKSAFGDIRQHRVNNPEDWPDDWVFTDSRFGLQDGDDELVLRFLAEMLHPLVRPDEEVGRLLNLSMRSSRETVTSSTQLTGSAAMPSTDGVVATLFTAQARTFGSANVNS